MLKTRIISAAIGIPIIIGLILWGRLPFFVLVTIIVAVGLYEFYQMLLHQSLHPNLIIGIASGVAFCLGALLRGEKGLEISLIILATVYFLWYLTVLGRPSAILDCAFTIFGSLYIGFLFSYLILMYDLPSGRLLIFLIIGGTWVADTSAYTVGTLIGKRKLAPGVSPHKTWEGAIAAVLFTPLVLASLYFFPVLSVSERIVLGLIVGVTSQIGDLAESKLKREMEVKDAGWIIPGHGGVLDRFDSLLFGGIVVYYYLKFVI